jgi:hypothetical protein
MVIDDCEYLVVIESTGIEIDVLGYDRACDEAYAQCIGSNCGYERVSVFDVGGEHTCRTYQKDGLTITRE